MKGKYHIVVQNNKLRYELNIRRNITIIRGDSATGKTRLIRRLQCLKCLIIIRTTLSEPIMCSD